MTANIEIVQLVHGGRVPTGRFQFEHSAGGGEILLIQGRPSFREGVRRDTTEPHQQDTAHEENAREDQGSPRCNAT
jgi:hypothetical protein